MFTLILRVIGVVEGDNGSVVLGVRVRDGAVRVGNDGSIVPPVAEGNGAAVLNSVATVPYGVDKAEGDARSGMVICSWRGSSRRKR